MAPRTYDCEICLSPFFSPSPPLPPIPIPGCGHYHCPRCLAENLTQSLKTLPFRPPICCNQTDYIPPSTFRRLPAAVPRETILFYRQKLTEYESLSGPRRLGRAPLSLRIHGNVPLQAQHIQLIPTYCHDPKCGAFIPDILGGRCRKCKKRTCKSCKAGFHLNAACKWRDLDTAEERTEMRRVAAMGLPTEREIIGRSEREGREREREMWELTRKLMGQMGWRRCPRCKAGVEKTEGCNHITCVCGCEWCYRCERVWGGSHRIGVGACAG